jgi:antitoxin YefM
MDIVNYVDARRNLKRVMDRVVADMAEILITRQNGEAVVMVSLVNWNSINETLHLLSSPRNAGRLLTAIR